MAKLIIRYPDNVINEVEFDQPKYKVGHAQDNDLVLDNDEVAPNQAEIETADGAYSIVDVSGNNSTAVNGKKIERVNLNYGDRISFGPVIGLFYPSKKSRVGDRTKLFLYVGTGALIILLSIFLIFYFTSRRLSTVVAQQIGEVVTPDEPARDTEKREAIREKSEEPVIGVEEEAGVEFETRERRLSFKGLLKREKLILPELGGEIIAGRDAVAIPRGLWRLFFRKIPVPVQVEIHLEAGEEVTFSPEEITFEEEIPSIETAPFEEEFVPPEEELAFTETGEEPEVFEEFEEEELQERGFITRMFSPIINIFTRNKEGELVFEEEIGEEVFPEEQPGIFPEEQPEILPEGEQLEVTFFEEGEAGIERPSADDIRRVIEPLAFLSGVEIPEIEKSELGEEPIYSESEIQEFRARRILNQIQISRSENLNIDVVWKYPEGLETEGAFIRAGTVGKIDEDKFHDFLFGTKNGTLIAVNGNTGVRIFSKEFGRAFYGPILSDLNNDNSEDIIIIFEDGEIVSYTAKLERLWVYENNDKITALPLLIDVNRDKIKDVIFTTLGMDVVAIDGSSGFEIWRFFDAESEIIFSPVGIEINNDSVKDVVFSTMNGYLYAIDGKTGWGLWKRSIFGRPAGSSSIGDLDGDKKYDIISLTQNGILTGYGMDGKLLFTYEMNGTYITAPSVGDTDGDKNIEILLIDENGVLKSIEGKTRREKWTYETEEGITFGRIALTDIDSDGGMDVLFTTLSGSLFILDGKTGNQMALYNYRDHVLTTPIIFDLNRDRIFEIVVGSYNGDVVALKVAGVKKKFLPFMWSFWITTNHDSQNTGYSSVYLFKKPWN